MNRQHLTIYGATGFTAKIIIAELLHGRSTRWPLGFKWSIAGRNRTALERLRAELQQGITNTIPLPDIMVADVRDQETLNNMACQTYCALPLFLSLDLSSPTLDTCSAAQLCRSLP